jgi:hypothetical protein
MIQKQAQRLALPFRGETELRANGFPGEEGMTIDHHARHFQAISETAREAKYTSNEIKRNKKLKIK